MTIDKIEYEWAESGDTTPVPSDAKIQTGYVGDEQPAMERFNFLQNRVEDKINRLQSEIMDSFYRDATDPQAMLMTGLWDESWGFPGDAANIMGNQGGVGGTDTYRAMCLFFDSANDPSLIVGDDDTDTFEVWNCRTMAKSDTSGDWHVDLPSGGAEDWQIQSACTDGTSLYGMFWNVTSDNYVIQAWDIATWDVKTGWAVTGIGLAGVGPAGGSLEGKIIMASATQLATLNRWIAIAAANSTAISILSTSDGTIEGSGAGDAFSAGASTISYGICSDGTNIYFGTKLGGTTAHVSTATIANPQVGSGGTGYPLSCGSAHVYSLTACGPNLIASTHSYTAPALGDVIIRTHNSAQADCDQILRGQDEAAQRGDYVYCKDPIWSVFDGLNLWILATIDDATTDSAGLIKIDVSKFVHTNLQDKSRELADVVSGIMRIQTGTNATGGDLYHVPPVFDGRDVWVVPEPDPSSALSGNIYRLPLALLRN